jgi:flagellar hook protein FlgE
MSALNTSVTGMLANSNWLSTIAQNVANANTPGYKDVETEFTTLVDQTAGGLNQMTGLDPNAGVATSLRSLNALQGSVEATSTSTDLAVQGGGFFVVSDAGGNIYLTRNGSFIPDSQGNLVNSAGYYLMGASVPANGGAVTVNSLSGLQQVNVQGSAASASPSTIASLVANLSSTAATVPAADLPSTNSAASTFTSQTSMVAYDNLGQAHTINLYFAKTGADTWEFDAYDASAAAVGGGFPYSSGPLATQTLTFSPTDGSLASGSPITFAVPGGQTLSLDLSQTTQLATGFGVNSATINGNAPGSLTGVTIATDGTLSFQYGNGSSQIAYEIPLATVESPDNLTSVLGGAYQANYQSGAAQVGNAGLAGRGTITSSAIEQSTVDLAQELTNMVQAQSSYEANSKVFQSGAKLLDVLNNLQT